MTAEDTPPGPASTSTSTSTPRPAGGITRRTTLRSLAGAAGLAGLAAVSGCRLAVDEARGAGGGGARRGGNLVVALGLDAQPVMVQAQTASASAWRRLVFETLTAADTSGRPRPLLATDWSLGDGGRTIAIRLRDDVRFHSGRPMTAQDVVFSLERTLDPLAGTQARAVSSLITDMSADGDHALRVRLRQPAGNIHDLFELTAIVDRESAGGLAEGRDVIGTGPFTWRSWTPGSQLTLARNPDYRVPGRPYLDGVEMPVITDPTALVTALRSNRADIAWTVVPLDAKGLSEDGRYDVGYSATVAYAVNMNVTAPPFDDARVRRAVGYAIDRDRIADQVFAGYGDASSLWWSRKEPGYSRRQAEAYTYQPARARRMIEEAGAAGAEVTIHVIGIQAARSTAEIVRYDLQAAGLRPTTRVLDVNEYSARQAAGDLGAMYVNGYGTADLAAATLVVSHPAFGTGSNASHFTPPAYAAVGQAAASASAGERPAAVRELGAYMQREAFSQALVTTSAIFLRSKRVRDTATTFLGALNLDDAYLV
ncbi:ABC transporter substrate-binding protein [Streptomyces sp. 6N223]|uniref:ABC transporter substrate-binding protein n=1 Tax=Streptomyces sp. 6N223 TaxID=3457412 RepID=UPI003FD687BF